MISLALATALSIAAAQASIDAPRAAFSNCLRTFMKTKIEAKLGPDAFDREVQPACASQEAAFRGASIAYDMKMGSSRGQAEEDANFQVDDYLTSMKDSYRSRYTGMHGK